MSDDSRLIDRAVETATKRTKTAHEDFVATPTDEEEALIRAAEVERRAEDLSVLADDAVDGEIGSDR